MKKILTKKYMLSLLEPITDRRLKGRIMGGTIFSPICPDYNFKETKGPGGTNERIHDFDGMGEDAGIVYEKLINNSNGFLKELIDGEVKYKHVLIVADVESVDKTILNKLGIEQKEFVRRCKKTVSKINKDLRARGLTNSKCQLMSELFEKEGYGFYKNISILKEKLLNTRSKEIVRLMNKTQKLRLPLYKYWFGLTEERGKERAIDDMAMYASFGHCLQVDMGVILCADSEILSRCYNLFKNKNTPVIYVNGAY